MPEELLNGWVDTTKKLPEVGQEVLGLVRMVKGKPYYMIAFTFKWSEGKEFYYFQVNGNPDFYLVKEVEYWQPAPCKKVR